MLRPLVQLSSFAAGSDAQVSSCESVWPSPLEHFSGSSPDWTNARCLTLMVCFSCWRENSVAHCTGAGGGAVLGI